MSRTLEKIEGKEYIFNAYMFKQLISDCIVYQRKEGVKSPKVIEEIAELTHVSVEAVNNWKYAKNGPGDIGIVKVIANYFKINYYELLTLKERKSMNETNIFNENNNVDPNKTKDVIRIVYQKMSAFMDAAVQELCFENDEESFGKYEELYKDMVGTLHKNMLDIPLKIYYELDKLIKDNLYVYMYGIPDANINIWGLCSFDDFCNKENLYGVAAKMYYMEKEADEFYANMREILKDYLLE